MTLSLNDAQIRVLQWVLDGADLNNPPSSTFKTSAVALQNRGLVELDKRRGRWSIAITDAGKFYLERGRHPETESPKPTPATATLVESAPKNIAAKQPTSDPSLENSAEPVAPAKPGPIVKSEGILIPDQVRRPHKAVREIVDHKARLDVPKEQRQRALLILHALS